MPATILAADLSPSSCDYSSTFPPGLNRVMSLDGLRQPPETRFLSAAVGSLGRQLHLERALGAFRHYRLHVAVDGLPSGCGLTK